MSFNPRAREGRDAALGGEIVKDYISFNPRAREGRDMTALDELQGELTVSIHAPVKGATKHLCSGCGNKLCFNPRAREGRDLILILILILI